MIQNANTAIGATDRAIENCPEFNTSFALTDNVKRARHGLAWAPAEYASLVKLFVAGHDLEYISEALLRPADGVISKLQHCGFIRYDSTDNLYHVINPPKPATTKRESTMSKQLIEFKVFINGTDATDMTCAEIFQLIAKTEDEIAKLRAIKTASKKLSGAISKLEADVIKLAEYVDSRE